MTEQVNVEVGVAPPEDGRSRTTGRLRQVCEAAKANPGEWCRIEYLHPHQAACSLRAGAYLWALPASQWECKGSQLESGKFLYVRFVGGADEADKEGT